MKDHSWAWRMVSIQEGLEQDPGSPLLALQCCGGVMGAPREAGGARTAGALGEFRTACLFPCLPAVGSPGCCAYGSAFPHSFLLENEPKSRLRS